MCSQSSNQVKGETGLLQRAIRGERAAVGELLYGSADELTSFISRRLPKSIQAAVSAEDIVQETFRVVLRDIGRFEPREDSSFMSWLRTIAAHRMKDAVKELGRSKRGGDHWRIETIRRNSADSVVDLFDMLVVDESTPLRRATRKEALQYMSVALAELPEHYREAIRLQYVEGKSYVEIAEAMGRTVDAVQGLIRRAKQKLRDALGHASTYLSSC